MKPVAPSKSWELSLGAPPLAHNRTDFIRPAIAAFSQAGNPRPMLFERRSEPVAEVSARRRIWELDGSLHCSAIGTCLSGGELRALIAKFHAPLGEKSTDHEVHTIAVAAVGKHNLLAKQIQKALDRRHAATIRHFSVAKTAEELRQLWKEARQAGEIPGAYWAVLSHPQTSDSLVREAFGDVHMLSHLVGAANRADIRRLHRLEEEKAALEAKLARQQTQLRDAVVSRDAKIRELTAALSARIEQHDRTAASTADTGSEIATVHALVADLRKLLDQEMLRRERAEKRAAGLTQAHGKSERMRAALAEEVANLEAELEAMEAQLSAKESGVEAGATLDLTGITVLYVGGRPHQVAKLRDLVARASGQLIHHDGGVEERTDLLPGLVSRASAAFFPVDCISHRAALMLKRLCQQAGKPYVPLRSAGIASMLRALTVIRGAEGESVPALTAPR